MKFRTIVFSLIAACFLGTGLGCGKGPEPNPVEESGRVDKLTQIRALFDKSHGDYNSLSAEDKAQMLKLCDGSQATVDTTWDALKKGSGGAVQPSASG